MGGTIAVAGEGALVVALAGGLGRQGLTVVPLAGDGPLDAAVVVAPAAGPARRFERVSDSDWALAWEAPMLTAIAALQRARARGATRVVVVVPTIGMSGGAGYVAEAAAAEGLRLLARSAARQWGPSGVTVNTVAAAPELFGVDTAAAGPRSLAPPALGGPGDPLSDLAPLVAALCSDAAHHLTGATLTADGGSWMAP